MWPRDFVAWHGNGGGLDGLYESVLCMAGGSSCSLAWHYVWSSGSVGSLAGYWKWSGWSEISLAWYYGSMGGLEGTGRGLGGI